MAEHLAKREELWGQREVSRQIVAKPEGGRPTGFATETTRTTGVSKRAVQRAVSRAKATRCQPMRSGRVNLVRLRGSAVDMAACPNLTDVRG